MAKSPKNYFPEWKLNKVITDQMITVPINANSVAQHVFIADQAYQVISVSEIHSVVGGAAAAVRVRKVTDTSAPGAVASTSVVEVAAAADLTATINTTQSPTISSTLTDLRLAIGDKLAINPTGTLTGLVGNVTVALRRI